MSVATSPPPSPPTSILPVPGGYAARSQAFDELVDDDGNLRAHWVRFAELLGGLGGRELTRRWETVQRQLRENGVTYNVYDDNRGMHRPWTLDPVPLLIQPDEWRNLERGLSQRAYLLNLVVDDLYGPRSLVRQRVLPPEVVYRNPGFLRPCQGAQSRGSRWLHLYAADIGRDPQGRFCVLGDRTQAPSGMGYALENRIVLSRVFPSLFRDCRVHRLAGFFRTLLDQIQRLSPRSGERPHAVVLTPGPYNETYFEHAYLARYLGLPLVEGGDLTVRSNQVFLKTLSGLSRVDVILRRTDDSFCDPLALRPDSSLGVAGLVAAVRSGNVAVLNALGSGITESLALLSYLPALCRHLLGEELLLPSVELAWLGSDDALTRAEQDFDKLVFKPAFARVSTPDSVVGAELIGHARSEFIDRLRSEPAEWVAQRRLDISAAPLWNGTSFEPRQVAIRCYAVGNGPGYQIMPGGLTRVAPKDTEGVMSMQHGAGSKDTWVLADGPVPQLSLLGRREERLSLSRSGHDLPSRVADNLYWLGRYIERAEGSARLLRRVLARLWDDAHAAEPSVLAALYEGLNAQHQLTQRMTIDAAPEVLERELLRFLYSPELTTGLHASLAGAHRAAAVVRDRISRDTWHVLSQLEDQRTQLAPGRLSPSELPEALDDLVLSFGAFAGLQNENLSRTYGYRFMDLGRRIERARNTAALIQATLGSVFPDEPVILSELLEVFDNGITYRRRYQDVMQAAPVLDLLLTDESNPRSIAFQLATIYEHIRVLPRSAEAPTRAREERVALSALTRVRLADIEILASPTVERARPALTEHLAVLGHELPELSNAITQSYLAHAVVQRAIGTEIE
ncbi:MAG: circularly permuted type 2 ATP-grasp protein [Polyangiales bacterium]